MLGAECWESGRVISFQDLKLFFSSADHKKTDVRLGWIVSLLWKKGGLLQKRLLDIITS